MITANAIGDSVGIIYAAGINLKLPVTVMMTTMAPVINYCANIELKACTICQPCLVSYDGLHTHTHCTIGYQPIKIVYPDSNQTTSFFGLQTVEVPIEMCSAYIPFQDPNKPPIRLFAISRSGRLIQLYPEEDLRIHGVPGQYSVEAGMICNDATNYCHSFFSVSRTSGIVFSKEEVDEIRQALQRQYVCTFSNKWETLSVTFNLTLLSSPSGILITLLLVIIH